MFYTLLAFSTFVISAPSQSNLASNVTEYRLGNTTINVIPVETMHLEMPPGQQLCPVLEEDFKTLDSKRWTHEITMAGGGNWEFQAYVKDKRVVYTQDNALFIQPIFMEDVQGVGFNEDGEVMDLYSLNSAMDCTSNQFYGCIRNGKGIPAIMSGAIHTTPAYAFKYGRVDVVAKVPKFDYAWPAIWLLPEDNVYGLWPTSGEIDIMESRGNVAFGHAADYQGVDYIASTLHYGPPRKNGASKNNYPNAHGYSKAVTGDYSDAFHTFSLDWNSTTITTYVDGIMVMSKSTIGLYATGIKDQTWDSSYTNVWGDGNAPFNQRFHLIINLAVGSGSSTADGNYFGSQIYTDSRDFWSRKAEWISSWNTTGNPLQSAMIVKSVTIQEYKPVASMCHNRGHESSTMVVNM